MALLRSFVAYIAALSALLVGFRVEADEFKFARSELLVEKAHRIELVLHRGYAELRVQRTVYNGGNRADEATFMIDVPQGAVATSMGTLGVRAGAPVWFEGELMEAEAAAAKYEEFTGYGGYYPKDPALLSWRSQEELALQVFPCLSRQVKAVRYTLQIPTVYDAGAFQLELPALGTADHIATIQVRSANSRDVVLVNGEPVDGLLRPEPIDVLHFQLIPRSNQRLTGSLASLDFASERALTHYSIEAASKLSEVPRGAYIIAMIDTSLSTDSGFIVRVQQALSAYLAHFEDAQVEVLLFNRKIERPFAGFVDVKQARQQLATLTVQQHNGSDLDRAFVEAGRDFERLPKSAIKRIVVLTDGLSRQGLDAERLRAATSGNDAVTHLGLLHAGTATLERDDDHPWAKGLEANRGIVWQVEIDADGQDESMKALFEEWVRPTRIHHLHAVASELSLEPTLRDFPDTLAEGQGLTGLELHAHRAPWIRIDGQLWTEPVSAVISSDAQSETRWSALVFGSELIEQLSESEMMTLAQKGGAVSPVTSYLTIEPGVRPSTEGLERGLWGIGHAFGAGSLHLMSAYPTVGPGDFDREGFLQTALAKEWQRCGGRAGEASITLETTRAEIVAVEASDFVVTSDATRMSCLIDAAWELVLPRQFRDDWQTYTVSL